LGQLVGTGDQSEAVVPVELVNDFVPEEPACASAPVGPSVDLLWIRPHQISKGSLGWDLHFSIDLSDLIERMNIRREPTMHTKDLICDK
jgi:hypothetical protein